jgi:hypothetical protein
MVFARDVYMTYAQWDYITQRGWITQLEVVELRYRVPSYWECEWGRSVYFAPARDPLVAKVSIKDVGISGG